MKALFFSILLLLPTISFCSEADIKPFEDALAKNEEPIEIISEEQASGIEPLELSLEKVFCLIESENLTILLNREKITESLEQAYIKRADLFPQISLNLSQYRFKNVNLVGTEGLFLATFQADRFDGTIDGNLPVFDLNKIAGYQAAKLGYQVSTLNYNAILQDILTEAGKLFYLYIRNLKSLDVTDANLKEAEALLKLAQARFDAGVASPIDVTKAEVQIAIYQRDRISKQVIIKKSELSLKQMLDICVDQPIKVTIESSNKERPAPNPSRPPVCEVYQSRYDYLTAYAQLQLNKYQRNAASWESFPVVNAVGNWGYASRLAFDGHSKEEWRVGLTLSMPLFDGYRIQSKVLKNESLIRQQEDILCNVVNTINTEYTYNLYALEARYAQIPLIRQQVKLGEQELELAIARYKEGVADNTDVTIAQNKLAEFMDNLVDILYLYDVSRLEWARTLGDVRTILCNAN